MEEIPTFSLSDFKSEMSYDFENIESERSNPSQYPFTTQLQQLETFKALFNNSEKQGLDRTSLIKHDIDVGGAKSSNRFILFPRQ